MTDARDWVPLDRALELITYKPLQDFLNTMAVHSYGPPFVRRAWLAECAKYTPMREATGRTVFDTTLVNWNSVCMSLKGWQTYSNLYIPIRFLAYRFLPHIQERFPGGAQVHRIFPGWVVGMGQPQSLCGGRDPEATLSRRPNGVTCTECLALLVEKVLL